MPRVAIGGLGQDDSSLADWASGSGSYDYTSDIMPAQIGPPLPSGAFTTATATPSDIAWAQQNAQYESSSFAPGGVTSYGTASTTANPFAQSAAGITSLIPGLVSSPAPVISTAQRPASILTSSSLISGIPDIVTIGGLGLILVLAMSGRGKKR